MARAGIAQADMLEAANRAAALLPSEDEDSDYTFRAREAISTHERLRKLPELSAFEQFFLDHDEMGFAEVLLYRRHIEHDSTSDFDTWLRALADDRLLGGRAAVIEAGVYPLLFPAYCRGGAELVAEIVGALEGADELFSDAAKRPDESSDL